VKRDTGDDGKVDHRCYKAKHVASASPTNRVPFLHLVLRLVLRLVRLLYHHLYRRLCRRRGLIRRRLHRGRRRRRDPRLRDRDHHPLLFRRRRGRRLVRLRVHRLRRRRPHSCHRLCHRRRHLPCPLYSSPPSWLSRLRPWF